MVRSLEFDRQVLRKQHANPIWLFDNEMELGYHWA